MKKFLTRFVLASGLAALAVVTGCESAPERHPKATQRVVLSADRAAADVVMEVITAVQFELPPGPPGSDGFVWETTADNVRVLEPMGPVVQGPPAKATFYALNSGRSVLHFVLVRPGEAEAIPAAKCEVTVRVSD
jgi:hypothetical protein